LSSRDETYRNLTYIAASEFSDIVPGTEVVEGKLRIFISDGSYIDARLSEKRHIECQGLYELSNVGYCGVHLWWKLKAESSR